MKTITILFLLILSNFCFAQTQRPRLSPISITVTSAPLVIQRVPVASLIPAQIPLAPLTPPVATYTSILDKKIKKLIKVETQNFQYLVYYIDKDDVFKVWRKNMTDENYYSFYKDKFLSLSIMTIPFKVRPAINDLKQFAKADVKNIGINFGVWSGVWNYYLSNGSINEYKLSAGIIIAPSAEELTSGNTQMVLSTGITIVGTYRAINLALIPVGIDYGLTRDSKDWVYNGKYWFGLGLGLDSKLFGF